MSCQKLRSPCAGAAVKRETPLPPEDRPSSAKKQKLTQSPSPAGASPAALTGSASPAAMAPASASDDSPAAEGPPAQAAAYDNGGQEEGVPPTLDGPQAAGEREEAAATKAEGELQDGMEQGAQPGGDGMSLTDPPTAKMPQHSLVLDQEIPDAVGLPPELP